MTRSRKPRLGRLAVVFVMAVAIPFVALTAYAQTPAEAPDVEMVWELMVLNRAPDGVQVAHLMHVINMGPRQATSVPLTVPEGARWMDVPEPLLAEDGRAVDPRPLAVGEERRYLVAYEIPWQRLPMAVRRPMLYPTHELHIWVRSGELEVRGVNVRAGGTEDFEGVPVDTYAMVGLQPHPAWQIVLDSGHSGTNRLPSLSPLGHRSDPVDILRTRPLPKIILGVLAVLAVFALIQRMRPARPQTDAEDVAAAGAASGTAREIEELKAEIVRVDVAFENGELDEATYKELRGRLKERLMALMSATLTKRTSGGERQ